MTLSRFSAFPSLPMLLLVAPLSVGVLQGSGCEEDPPDPPGSPTPGPDVAEACYLGVERSYDTCYQVVTPEVMPSGYDYPAPYNGSVQYTEPIAYLDLEAIDDSDMLAPNFRIDELAQDYKGQYAVLQTHAVEHLQDMRDELGVLVINSGYRSPGYNATIDGSATYSRHMYGDAFDIDPSSVTLDELANTCYRNGAGYVGMYETHVHCDWRDDPLDEAFYGDVYGGSRTIASAPAPRPRHLTRMVLEDGVWTAPSEDWDEGEPLREWWALDGAGRIIEHQRVRAYVPPSEALEIRVRVGGLVELTHAL